MQGSNNPAKNLFVLSLTLIVMIVGLGFGTSLFLYSYKLLNSSALSNKNLQTRSLKIGILGNQENYLPLADYLKKQFGGKLEVVVDGYEKLSYQEAKARIATKQWDIAFTLSPMVSVAAKDNGYFFATRMFPRNPPYYQSAIFVRANSPIKSIEDLTPNTTIALGDFNSASSFYMPVYDLFGKTLNVKMGLRGQQIREMVQSGEVDIGAGAFGDTVTKDPNIRIIHQSRNIPGSGVYLSPNLSQSDREAIRQVLLDAPAELQKKANFGKGKEPDYSFFLGISRRTEQVLSCSDFTKNPVNFFCADNNSKRQTAMTKNTSIVGRVNGWSRPDDSTIRLNLSSNSGKLYSVVVTSDILNQIPNVGNTLSLQNKMIEINSVYPKKINNKLELVITEPNQLRLFE